MTVVIIVPSRVIRYPVTATLSLDASHDRLIEEGDVAVPATPLGVLGGSVSPAGADEPELPSKSAATSLSVKALEYTRTSSMAPAKYPPANRLPI